MNDSPSTNRPSRRRAATGLTAALVLGAVLLGGCQGRTLFRPGTGTSGGSGEQVDLTDRDLAPVDAFISARNAQWILGDEVEVLASKEYFAQYLTVNAAVGFVERRDTTTLDETTVRLTFIGDQAIASVERNPRILIGTGLTVSARRHLVLRLVRTRDASVPVQLRVTARGNAVRGKKDEVLERAPELRLGGSLVQRGGVATWHPLR
ncbi:MAG: hypothetical protein ACYTG6_15900 [Planctomycetota bacterium]|jgi:hypothetical protein